MVSIVPSSTTIHQNGHTADANALQYIEALLAGSKPEKPDVGRYAQPIGYLDEEFDRNPGNVENVLRALIKSKKYPELAALFNGSATSEQSSFQFSPDEQSNVPELPQELQNLIDQNDTSSLVLDAIIDFFRYWCTRSYEGYHEAAAVWILSAIAARRVFLNWRTGVWTPLYVMIVSESTSHAKTEVPKYVWEILNACGLTYLLTSDEISPQKMLSNMAGQYVPRNYSTKDRDGKEYIRLSKAFSGQHSWIYDEFGNKLQETVNARGSYVSLLYSLLKQLYDCKKTYKYDTRGYGEEIIDMPYLSLIGTASPACLKPVMSAKSATWTDGTAARFAWVVPPKDELKLQSAPNEPLVIPQAIIDALQKWHFRLGFPACQIIDTAEQESLLEQARGEEKGKKKRDMSNRPPFEVEKGDLPQSVIYMSNEVYQAQDEYYKALATLGFNHGLDERFKSTYGRLPEKALRIAMLLASLENSSHVNMRHFARGMQITEHWRRDFHELIAQLSNDTPTGHGAIEDKVLEVITTKLDGKMATSYTIARLGGTLLRKAGTEEVRKAGDELVAVQLIRKEGSGKAAMYGVKEEK